MLTGLGSGKRRRLLGRPRRNWENNIQRDLQEVGWEGMDWFDLAEDRQVEDSCRCRDTP